MEISFQDVAGGALQEKANQAFTKVMQNMQDPNTPWKNKRKINICLSFEQNEDRTDCTCNIAVDTRLAPVKPVNTKFCIGNDLATGKVFAREYGPGIKGQMSFEDVEQGMAEHTVGGDGRNADVETEGTGEETIIDFRAERKA